MKAAARFCSLTGLLARQCDLGYRTAPIDLTGYWVSLIVERWRFRGVTAEARDIPYLPLNAAARRAADLWDPVQDEAGGTAYRPPTP